MLLRQACRSLAEAHDHGLVHRDIKPANLFVTRLGSEYDYLKVLDFGIVKDQPGQEATMLSSQGIMQGTPAFMAPELIFGENRIDGRLRPSISIAGWRVSGASGPGPRTGPERGGRRTHRTSSQVASESGKHHEGREKRAFDCPHARAGLRCHPARASRIQVVTAMSAKRMAPCAVVTSPPQGSGTCSVPARKAMRTSPMTRTSTSTARMRVTHVKRLQIR
jgi:hypothetical protein